MMKKNFEWMMALYAACSRSDRTTQGDDGAGWSLRLASVEDGSFGYFRGAPALLLPLFSRIPILRDVVPSMVRVRTLEAPR